MKSDESCVECDFICEYLSSIEFMSQKEVLLLAFWWHLSTLRHPSVYLGIQWNSKFARLVPCGHAIVNGGSSTSFTPDFSASKPQGTTRHDTARHLSTRFASIRLASTARPPRQGLQLQTKSPMPAHVDAQSHIRFPHSIP